MLLLHTTRKARFGHCLAPCLPLPPDRPWPPTCASTVCTTLSAMSLWVRRDSSVIRGGYWSSDSTVTASRVPSGMLSSATSCFSAFMSPPRPLTAAGRPINRQTQQHRQDVVDRPAAAGKHCACKQSDCKQSDAPRMPAASSMRRQETGECHTAACQADSERPATPPASTTHSLAGEATLAGA